MIRRWRCLIAVAAVSIAALTAQPAGATTVQRVVSPGGIVAWLVHEPSLPLVALNFAFVGGATQDPVDKPGVGYMVSSLLDDGAVLASFRPNATPSKVTSSDTASTFPPASLASSSSCVRAMSDKRPPTSVGGSASACCGRCTGMATA